MIRDLAKMTLVFVAAMSNPAFAASVVIQAHSPLPEGQNLRIPAKIYGDALSVRARLTMPTFTSSIPFWFDLSAKKSTVDKVPMQELGFRFQGKEFQPLFVEIADIFWKMFPFAFAKSESASLPNFPSTCCMGVLGQDFFSSGFVLADYDEVTAGKMASLEWASRKEDLEGHNFEKFNFEKGISFDQFPFRSLNLEWNLRGNQVLFDLKLKKAYPLKTVNQFSKISVRPMQFNFVPPERSVQIFTIADKRVFEILKKSNVHPKYFLKTVNGLRAEHISLADLNWAVQQAVAGKQKYKFQFAKLKNSKPEQWIDVTLPE